MFFKKKPVAKAMSRDEFLSQHAQLKSKEDQQRLNARFDGEEVDQETGGFRGDPEQLAKLKEGVEAWNAWRKENPEVKIDLSGADLSGASLFRVDLSGADLIGGNLSDSYLGNADFSGANLAYANLSRAMLTAANLGGADLRVANLSGAEFEYAKLNGAILVYANLSSAILTYANLSGAVLSLANFANTRITGVIYSRRLLRNRCHGVRAAECYGDAQFRRDVMDQDILDQRLSAIERSVPANAYSILWFVQALLSGVKFLPLFAGALVGLLFKSMIEPFDGTALIGSVSAGQFSALMSFLPYVAAGVGGAVFLAGTLGRLFAYWVWSMFDFGRDWDRVILFAFFMVLAFGGVYSSIDGVHVSLASAGSDIWFYPWFTALMGFATLGIADFVTPLTNLGGVVIMANVLSGFVTLGLLLSVLGDGFARRS